jgi:cytochrome P450
MKRTGCKKYEDAVQWLLDAHAARGKDVDPVQITRDIFIIMTASIHSTSGAGLCVILDMMEHPEAVQEIKEEIARVTSANPTWTRQALSELRLLDSFMRESARVHSLTQCRRLPVHVYVQRLSARLLTFSCLT